MLSDAPVSSYGSSLKLALSGVDLIGWSLYKPFSGTNYDDVKNNQQDAAADLRNYLDDMGLKNISMTIFEFGVRNRFWPSNWDSALTDLCDQSTAYHAWIELLQKEETSVKSFFTFWFDSFDPRYTTFHAILDYKENYKIHPNLSQCT